VSWKTYERLLAHFGDSHAARLTFDQGMLEIMALSFAHERSTHLLAQIVEALTEVRDLDLISAGATTFKREDMQRGFTPDTSFYMQHGGDVHNNTDIDLQIPAEHRRVYRYEHQHSLATPLEREFHAHCRDHRQTNSAVMCRGNTACCTQ
jgi:hypothetical protein